MALYKGISITFVINTALQLHHPCLYHKNHPNTSSLSLSKQSFSGAGMFRKSPRVADESMFVTSVNNGDELATGLPSGGGAWGDAFSVMLSVVRAPLLMLTCFSHPHVTGADGVWVSGEFAQVSEMNHLMVNDSMRYAILM